MMMMTWSSCIGTIFAFQGLQGPAIVQLVTLAPSIGGGGEGEGGGVENRKKILTQHFLQRIIK